MKPARIRSLGADDVAACVAIANAVDPAHSVSLEVAQHRDDTWDAARFFRARYVAEGAGGQVPGWGQIAHSVWQFHPDRYALRLEVHPEHRRRGAGGLLFERLVETLRSRDALLVRCVAIEGDGDSIGFLARRGFQEVWRNLESRLDVPAFDPAPFSGAAERVARQAVAITTLAEELASDPRVLRDVYELQLICNSAQQELDPVTPPPFEGFISELEGPRSMPDAWFLAKDGQRFVGVSTLERLTGSADRLEVGYTAVHPAYRGRGIALALKLRAITYAQEHGYQSIETDSNAVNERMLSINAHLGFQPLPARITFELPLTGGPGGRPVRLASRSPRVEVSAR